jgi:hypothetical protein
MLAVAARFHTYSLGNQLLIAVQNPDATRVAGFEAWKALKRYVRKGERGIAILAPMTFTRRTDTAPPANPDTTNGAGVASGDEDSVQTFTRFKVVHVFDPLSQESWWCAERPGLLLAGYAPRAWLEYRWLGRPSVRTDAERSKSTGRGKSHKHRRHRVHRRPLVSGATGYRPIAGVAITAAAGLAVAVNAPVGAVPRPAFVCLSPCRRRPSRRPAVFT